MHNSPVIGLLGDDRGHTSHMELNALAPRIASELGAEVRWVPTDSSFDVREFAGIWLVPGSPYVDDAAVVDAISTTREHRIPFLGTCAGMQYAVVEYLRNALGESASHAESDGERDDNAVAALACSLYGERRLVSPVAGSRFAELVAEPFVGMHFCNFSPTPDAITRLQRAGVVVGATAEDAGAEVLEFPELPFFMVSMFQPHIGAAAGEPIHPLIRAFVDAARTFWAERDRVGATARASRSPMSGRSGTGA